MKVVQVSATRDYEGVQWTALFSSVDKALDWVRNVDADQWFGVNDVDVAWVGVDTPSYDRVCDFEVRYDYAADQANFVTWDPDDKEYVPFVA